MEVSHSDGVRLWDNLSMECESKKGTGLWDGAWPGVREMVWCRAQGRGTRSAGSPSAILLCSNLWESLTCQTIFSRRTGDIV